MKQKYAGSSRKSNQKSGRNLPEGWAHQSANGTLAVQLPLPMVEVLRSIPDCIESMARQVGLLLAQSVIEEEVRQLAGERHARDGQSVPYRWGREDGYLIFGGTKVPLARPRVRHLGKEVALESYDALRRDGKMQRAVKNKVVLGVSMRNYARAVDEFVDGYGIKKSSASRHFVAVSAQKVQELCERKLDGLKLAALILDGVHYAGLTIVVALGIDENGRKHVLGLYDGASENTAVCQGLLEDLIRRGLDPNAKYLCVIDGSKALAAAIRKVFGKDAPIQRCQVHKKRNVREHLPPKYHAAAMLRLSAAYGMKNYPDALDALKKTVKWLRELSESAAASLEEGMEETLTVHRLELPETLRKTFASTNCIESCFSRVGHLTRNVKNWKNVAMVRRWMGTMLLEAEQTFRRIKGHRSMPMLINALLPRQELAEKRAAS